MDKRLRSFFRLRWACRCIILAATLISIWSNVQNSEPTFSAIVIHVFPPLFVFGGFEIISRVPLRKEAHWIMRFARPLGALIITGISAWLSYWNQNEAFFRIVHDPDTAYLLPIAIDGFMLVASVTLIELNARIEALEAYAEAGRITTSKPKDAEIAPKPQDKKPSKKERIAEILARSPELKDQEVGGVVGASPGYVYSVRRELEALKLEDVVFADPMPAMA
jgi:hypothetical protein